MLPENGFIHKKRFFLALGSMCFCCLILFSCISLPGEEKLEEKNKAAEYYEIGLKYIDIKQYDKALSCFQKAREKTDETLQIDYQIARTYALSNKWEQAAESYNNLLALDPDNSTLKENYAYTLYKSGEKEKALQMYAELCEKNPGEERIAQNYEKLYNEAYPPVEEELETTEEATPENDAETVTEQTETGAVQA